MRLTQAIRKVRRHLPLLAPKWVEISSHYKKLPQSAHSQEWFLGPLLLARYLRLWEESLTSKPRGLFPQSLWDRMLFTKVRAHPCFSSKKIPATNYRDTLVLGAGNVPAIPLTDSLFYLAQGVKVCLKLSPHHSHLYPIFDSLLQPFRQMGILEILLDEEEVEWQQALGDRTRYPHLHFTGSQQTLTKILEQHPQRRSSTHCELGCVTPYILIPGSWNPLDLDFHASQLAASLTFNSGHNCVTPQLLITDSSWSQREEFLERLTKKLRRYRQPRWYPNSQAQLDRWCQQYASHRLNPHDPWPIFTDLPAQGDHLQKETFCGCLFEIPVTSLQEMIQITRKAYGTLSCSVIIDPQSQKQLGQRWTHFLQELHYGMIAVNSWGGFSYALGNLPWGSFEALDQQPLENSGRGWVHTFLEDPSYQKTILEAPFRPLVPWPWIPRDRATQAFCRQLLKFETQASLANLGKLGYRLLQLQLNQ